MAQKLKVEVDLDTTKAKEQGKQLSEAIESSSSGASPAADKLGKSLDKAASGADALGAAAKENAAKMQAAVKVFGGAAIKMAATYAANNMEAGAGRTAVSAIGDMASGAMMGSAFGPIGTAAGALMGAANAWMSAAKEEKERAQSISRAKWEFDKAENDYKNQKDFAARLKGWSDAKTPKDTRLNEIDAEIEKTKALIDDMVKRTKEMIAAGDLEKAGMQREYLAGTRQNLDRLEALRETVDNQKGGSPFRESMTGTDALTRIGANFGGADTARDQLTVAKDQLDTLKRIEQKTNGGASWQ